MLSWIERWSAEMIWTDRFYTVVSRLLLGSCCIETPYRGRHLLRGGVVQCRAHKASFQEVKKARRPIVLIWSSDHFWHIGNHPHPQLVEYLYSYYTNEGQIGFTL